MQGEVLNDCYYHKLTCYHQKLLKKRMKKLHNHSIEASVVITKRMSDVMT